MEIVKGQPIKLPDGTLLLPSRNEKGSKIVSASEVKQIELEKEVTQELQEVLRDPIDNQFTETYKRTLADVETDYARMNIVMLVLAYTTWGLDEYAISQILSVRQEQIEGIKESDIYTRTRQELIDALRYAETASVHGYLASKAQVAAKAIATLLTNPSADTRLAAAKDILDRSGFRPADRVEHVHKFEDELRIRYVSDDVSTPTIDLNAEDI